MPLVINHKKNRNSIIAKGAIDALMVNLSDQESVSFDQVRNGLSRSGLTDGEIHQSMIDAGYEVVE